MIASLRRWWTLPAAVSLLVVLAALAASQETVEKQPKIVILFDVSASMNTIDGPEIPGRDPLILPTRQDQVLAFLTGIKKGKTHTVLDELLTKAPISAYRFGSTLDQLGAAHLEAGKTWSADEWARWLKAERKLDELRDGTDIAGAALQMLEREKNSYIQAIVIVSDGRGTRSASEDIEDFLDAVRNPERPIPVFTVGVGLTQTLPSIRLHGLQAPHSVRPDDKFLLRVPLEVRGLAGEAFQLLLEAQRVKDADGRPVTRAMRYLPGPTIGKFSGDAIQHVEIEIDLAKLKKDAPAEGTWRFSARVASHPREPFTGAEHVSEPIDVVARERMPRVLLFAGGATREFQFLRTMLHREMLESRLEVCICLQTGREDLIDQDLEAERFLKEFPAKLGPNDAGKRFQSLSDYDAIVAFDPDWSKLSKDQQKQLRTWVSDHGGGIIFVAGPVHTFQWARPLAYGLDQLTPMFPVVVQDSRLQGLMLPPANASRPYVLSFNANTKAFPFLKLDDRFEDPLAGWKAFFWNDQRGGAGPQPKRGFFSYYPVERLKPAAEVIAAFAGPKETRIGDKTDAFADQQPYIVSMRHGTGRSLFLGAGEFWRLRAYKTEYHERFWLGLLRHVAVPPPGQALKHGQILMSRAAVAGVIPIEARILDKDLTPLAVTAKPMVEVRNLRDGVAAPLSFELASSGKPSRFAGSLKLAKAGDYLAQIAIPGTSAVLNQRISVRAADRETDDVRIDFAALHALSSDAKPLLAKLSVDRREDVTAALRASSPFVGAEPRLFFRLADADVIPTLLEKLPPKAFPKQPPPRIRPQTKSAEVEHWKLKPTNVLIVDGEGARGRAEGGDSFFVELAITSLPRNPYTVFHGDKESRGVAVNALDGDLSKFGVILLLNVKSLSPKQTANLEAFAHNGGGVAFFLGPNVDAEHYNKNLHRAGKGIFPAPLEKTCFPALTEPALEADMSETGLVPRNERFAKNAPFPNLAELFDESSAREFLRYLPVYRYYKVPRGQWRPDANRSLEMATLPNLDSVARFEKPVAALTRGTLRKLKADESLKAFRPALARHVKAIEWVALPGSDAKGVTLAVALDAFAQDPALHEFWKNASTRAAFAEVVALAQQARPGDPFLIGGQFGKGRTIAMMTTAGRGWTDFAIAPFASILYSFFITDMLHDLSGQGPPPPPEPLFFDLPKVRKPKYGPEFVDVAPDLEPRRPLLKTDVKDKAPVYLVTPDALVPFHGALSDSAGLVNAHWIVQVVNGKDMKPEAELRVPLEQFYIAQHRRAVEEATLNALKGAKDRPFPTGQATYHTLYLERGFDFQKHLGRLKSKDTPQPTYLVKLWLEAEGGKSGKFVVRSQPMLFLIVSENEVIAQVMLDGNDIEDRLDRAHKNLHEALDVLGEESKRLLDADVDRAQVAARLRHAWRNVQPIPAAVGQAETDMNRVVTRLVQNRARPETIDKVAKLTDSMRKYSTNQSLHDAISALDALSTEAETAKPEQVRKRIEATRKLLEAAAPDLNGILIDSSMWLLEAQLINRLLAIEQKQADFGRDRERIERLILVATSKKK